MFSKSERFRAKASGVPAPGTYNLKWQDTSSGPASFDKSARFRQEEATGDYSFADDSICSATPISREESTGQKPLSKPKVATKDGGKSRKVSLPPANSARIAELEREVKRLVMERNDLSKQLSASKAEITKLEGKVQMAVRDKSAMQAHIASLQKENLSLVRGKDILEAMVSSEDRKTLEVQLTQLKADKDKLQADLALAEQTITDNTHTASTLHKQIKSLESEVASLGADKLGLQEQLKIDDRRLEEIKNEMEKLQVKHQEALESLTRKCLAFEEELAHQKKVNKERHTILESQLKAAESAQREQASEYQATIRVLSAKEAEVTHLKTDIEKLEAERKKLKRSEKKHQSELAESMSSLKEARDKITSLEKSATERHLAFEKELAHQKKVSKEKQNVLESQLKAAEAAHKKQTNEYQATIKALNTKEQGTVADLKSQMKSLTSEHRKLQDNDVMLQSKLTESTACLKEAQDKIGSLKKQLERTKLATATTEDDSTKQAMTKRLEDAQKKLSLQEAQNKEMQSELLARIADLEAENERLRKENEELSKAYAAIEERFRPYMSQLDELEDLNRLLQRQTKMAKSEAERLGDQYAKLLGHQNHRQKIQHVKKLKDENASLKEEITKLKNEIERHKRNIRKLEEENGVSVSQLKKTKPLVAKN